MKAKLYVFENQMEIRLADDVVVAPKKNEDNEKFIARVKAMVTDEYLDDEFELIEIDAAIVAINDDTTLTKALESAEGLQKKLIAAVLGSRKPAGEKEKKEKILAVTAEEAKASEAYKAVEANIGKHVSFSPFKSEEVYQGKIAGIALNKTNTIIYYTVVEKEGKRRCCAVKNESIVFIDAPVEEVKDKPEKVKSEKVKKEKVEEVEVVGADIMGETEQDDLM